MSKRLKALVVRELQEEFHGLDRCIVVGLSGLPAGSADKIRADLESKNVRLRIVKNTLAGVALREVGITGMEAFLDGQNAVVTGGVDIVDLAKTADELVRSRGGVVLKGGFGEGKVLSPADLETLSKIPSREELLSMLAYALSGTMVNFASVLGAVQRKFLYAVTALKDQKESAAA